VSFPVPKGTAPSRRDRPRLPRTDGQWTCGALTASPTPEGSPATVTLSIDGQQAAQGRIDEQVPMRCGTETMDVGMDCVSPVCNDYEKHGLFPFTGTIESVTFEFGPHQAPTGMELLEMSTKMD
jgi:arylsulfatase